jgi:hypothetical protein
MRLLATLAFGHCVLRVKSSAELPEASKFENNLIINIEDRLGFVLMRL